MSHPLPLDVILPVDHIDVRLDTSPHPFVQGREKAIAENWALEVREKPAVFNGTVVLLSEFGYADGRLYGRCHAVSYSTFLYWRKDRVATVAHAFAHPMLVSSDNALIAIRMAAHTVNAGKVYFAAGSFEPEDFPDGKVDAHGNMVREVREETGIDISDVRREERYHALATERGTVIFRRYFVEEDAESITSRIRDFVAAESEPEIEGPVVIRNARDLAEGLMEHMKPMIDWHFSGT
ncbi:NUDIX domain-containing protein [Mesorhizobium sp. VNQ89]|uniref:NUDIX domain-containing protein n=1 Tax=Mesorhizobium quangtriensis TaxID=3157709 RepID=UPI0032B76D99